MKASLSPNDLMIQVDFAEKYKMSIRMPFEVLILVINASAFSQRFAILMSIDK